MKRLFFGGIHPRENKWYTCDKEIQMFPEPDVLIIPMSQHIGAPCKPLVKKGDLVTVGQKIGDNQGLCVPVHASVSGKVKAVENKPHTNGSNVMSVVIENDHQKTLCEDIKPRTQEEVDALSKEDLSTVGGHLVEGCIINTTCELVIGQLEGYEYDVEFDEETGYDELLIRAL